MLDSVLDSVQEYEVLTPIWSPIWSHGIHRRSNQGRPSEVPSTRGLEPTFGMLSDMAVTCHRNGFCPDLYKVKAQLCVGDAGLYPRRFAKLHHASEARSKRNRSRSLRKSKTFETR